MNMRDLIPWSRGREFPAGRAAEQSLASFQRDVERLFEDMWRGFDAPLFAHAGNAAGTLSPRIEVKEKDDAIVVAAELPGLDEKNVEVTLTESVLTIRGEKKVEKETDGKEKGYTYSERSYGAFERRIPLDAEVMADKVTADFTNGVLTVTLPKSSHAQEKARRIEIGKTTETPAAAA